MPLKFYLDKRKNKYGESPIRMVWSFNGDRFQTTAGFSIPPAAWDARASRVIPGVYNHKKTPSTTINPFLAAWQRAVNRMEDYARRQNAVLTKKIVKKIIDDVRKAGGDYPSNEERFWMRMLEERSMSQPRYFEHYKGGKYKLLGFGKNSETLEEVVIYQALHGNNEIWVRPQEMFFGKVTLPDGTEAKRFKEITL